MKRALLLAFAALGLPAAAQMYATQPSYQGLWWNSPPGSEAGWGVNIAHQGDILFATWFTYDTDGRGLWLVMPRGALEPGERDPYYGDMSSTYMYSGTLYRTTGPAFDSASFDPAAVQAVPVGTATFRFTSAHAGTFVYSIGSTNGSKAITRQMFSNMPDCTLGGSAGSQPNYQDLWWRSPAGSESGWGVNITHQGDILFATWFTYGADGRGMWLVVPAAARTGPSTYSGELLRTTGPPYSSPAWDVNVVTRTPVGSATFAFSDAATGTFTYTVDGATRSKPITRQVFASPPTVCR